MFKMKMFGSQSWLVEFLKGFLRSFNLKNGILAGATVTINVALRISKYDGLYYM